jgi:hypothetical protein
MDSKKIVISSGCQTYGLAPALSAMCNISEPTCVQNIGVDSTALKIDLQRELQDAAVFVFSNNNTVASEVLSEIAFRGLAVKVPVVQFHAFHPDICYAYHKHTMAFTRQHYNSAIALWAYCNKLDVAKTTALYREEVFYALGYFGAWEQAVKALQENFNNSDLRSHFRDFYLEVKRHGVFMHTINHPTLVVLIALAKAIANHVGVPIKRQIPRGQLNDNLNGSIWPIYPEIAHHLALDGGSYTWKFTNANQTFDGIKTFVDHSFNDYREQGLEPEVLQFVPSSAQFLGSMDELNQKLPLFV